MKRILSVFALIVLLFALPACTSLSPSPYGELPHSGTVTMTTQFPVYAADSETIQVAMTNGSGDKMTCGAVWRMEVLENGEWMRIPFKENTFFDSIAYTLLPGGTHVFTAYPAMLDYTVTDGTYRIAAEVRVETGATAEGAQKVTEVYAAEFTVGESVISGNAPYGYAPLENLPADYSAEDAAADGVVMIESSSANPARLSEFFSQISINMDAQIRFGTQDSQSGDALLLTDILAERKQDVWRIRRRTRSASGEITETIYSHFVTDGEQFALANEPHWPEDESEMQPLFPTSAWDGGEAAVDALYAMQKENSRYDPLRPSYWSPDGMKEVTLSHRGPLKFGFTVFTENGYSGSARGITNVPGMTAIRSVLWTADNETVLFVCDTDKENRTGYVFYSITEEAVLRYTTSAHDYVIDENGEISIPE